MAIYQTPLNSKLSKELLLNRCFDSIIYLEWLLGGAKDHKKIRDHKNFFYDIHATCPQGFLSLLLDSNLHKKLELIVPKANTHIDGKYKKAKVYLFETEHFYIAAICETGQRGSDWLFLDKNNFSPSKGYSSGHELFMIEPQYMNELVNFFQEITWILFQCSSTEKQTELIENNTLFIHSLHHKFPLLKKYFLTEIPL